STRTPMKASTGPKARTSRPHGTTLVFQFRFRPRTRRTPATAIAPRRRPPPAALPGAVVVPVAAVVDGPGGGAELGHRRAPQTASGGAWAGWSVAGTAGPAWAGGRRRSVLSTLA